MRNKAPLVYVPVDIPVAPPIVCLGCGGQIDNLIQTISTSPVAVILNTEKTRLEMSVSKTQALSLYRRKETYSCPKCKKELFDNVADAIAFMKGEKVTITKDPERFIVIKGSSAMTIKGGKLVHNGGFVRDDRNGTLFAIFDIKENHVIDIKMTYQEAENEIGEWKT
jgi:uncharacterized Zn ribbon protein